MTRFERFLLGTAKKTVDWERLRAIIRPSKDLGVPGRIDRTGAVGTAGTAETAVKETSTLH